MKKLVLFFLFLVCSAWQPESLLAQTMLVSDAISIRNDYGYELIGRLRDRILVFRDKYNDFEIQAYDTQMRLAWSRTLEDIDSKGIQIVAVVAGKNDFSVIHKIRRHGYAVLRIHKYDPGANLIDSMLIKDYGERLFNPPVLNYIYSEDRNCIAVYNTSDRSNLEVTCFQLDKMQVLWDKTFELKQEFDEYSPPAMVLSNKGDFYLLSEENNRSRKMDEHTMNILQVQNNTDRLAKVPLPNFLTSSAKCIFDNKNNQLVVAGLYSEKNKENANGAFYLRMTAGANAPQVLRYEPFDDKFVSILRQKDVSDDGKGISDSEVRQLVLRQDGGAVMVVERSHQLQRGASSGRGFWRDGMRLVIDYYFDDVYVLGFQPDGQPQWKTVLHKKQYSQDDEGTFSSFFLFMNQDKLRFMFNDEIKYENTCSEYVLTPLGEFDRNSLLTTVNQSLRLRFRDALQLNSGECLIPSEFRNKLRLVLLRW
ncbi:MAG: hypothetical protein LCH81_01715 [Bacteroidetes bacterium]|nr:hypothetical protein [Bacteroidota bacterium]